MFRGLRVSVFARTDRQTDTKSRRRQKQYSIAGVQLIKALNRNDKQIATLAPLYDGDGGQLDDRTLRRICVQWDSLPDSTNTTLRYIAAILVRCSR